MRGLLRTSSTKRHSMSKTNNLEPLALTAHLIVLVFLLTLEILCSTVLKLEYLTR
jgi:hypothetical protein